MKLSLFRSGSLLYGFCGTLLLLAFSSCSRRPHLERIAGFAQGSYYAVSYYTAEKALKAENLMVQIDSILTAFDSCASLWNEQSEICRVNRNEDFQPSPMFCDLFLKARQIAERTDGAFDYTVGPLVKRYGFSKSENEGKGRNLPEEELLEILSYIGWEKAYLRYGKVEKDHPLIQLDFNAIAQGYCAGVIADFLQQSGIEDYLVDVGGEICAKGRKPDGKPWIVGIERPAQNALDERIVLQSLALTDKSLVTSGSSRKYFEENGRRFPHTVDPESGRPIQNNLLSATILCDECWEADGIATACMVWGLERTQKFLSENPGRYEAFLIYADSAGNGLKTWHTEDFPLVD